MSNSLFSRNLEASDTTCPNEMEQPPGLLTVPSVRMEAIGAALRTNCATGWLEPRDSRASEPTALKLVFHQSCELKHRVTGLTGYQRQCILGHISKAHTQTLDHRSIDFVTTRTDVRPDHRDQRALRLVSHRHDALLDNSSCEAAPSRVNRRNAAPIFVAHEDGNAIRRKDADARPRSRCNDCIRFGRKRRARFHTSHGHTVNLRWINDIGRGLHAAYTEAVFGRERRMLQRRVHGAFSRSS